MILINLFTTVQLLDKKSMLRATEIKWKHIKYLL